MRSTILLVDDDEVFREAVAVVLESRFEIVTAANGTEALRAVAANRPDLIILDVMMDSMSEGFDVARELRSNAATADIPIIMLTGVDRVYNLRMTLDQSQAPADRFLEKPIGPGELLGHVNDLLGGERS